MEIDQLGGLIKDGDAQRIAQLMNEHGLTITDGKIVATNEERQEWITGQIGFWDQRQQARKIL